LATSCVGIACHEGSAKQHWLIWPRSARGRFRIWSGVSGDHTAKRCVGSQKRCDCPRRRLPSCIGRPAQHRVGLPPQTALQSRSHRLWPHRVSVSSVLTREPSAGSRRSPGSSTISTGATTSTTHPQDHPCRCSTSSACPQNEIPPPNGSAAVPGADEQVGSEFRPGATPRRLWPRLRSRLRSCLASCRRSAWDSRHPPHPRRCRSECTGRP